MTRTKDLIKKISELPSRRPSCEKSAQWTHGDAHAIGPRVRWWVAVVALIGCRAHPEARPANVEGCRCAPGQACWPSDAEWDALGSRLTGKLEVPVAPTAYDDPFVLEEQSGATQSTGWLDAWTAAPSARAIAAQNAEDVAAGVRFASEHHLRVAIKAT